MKRNFLNFGFLISGIFVIILLGTSLISCEKLESNTNLEEEIDYELIGAEHNKGLDYVFNYVKQKTSKENTKLKSKSDFLILVEEGTQEFLKNNDLLQNEVEKNIAINESKKPYLFYSYIIKNDLKSATLEKLWPDDVDNLLTNKQKEILNEMNEIISNSTELDDVINAFNIIDLKINSECSDKERDVLLCATSIGRHSFQYWHDNLDLWINEFGSAYNLKSNKSFSWSEVGKNDVAYGVGGGAAGAIVGGSVSLGVLTLPGWAAGAIGGAVGGSIGNAILQIW